MKIRLFFCAILALFIFPSVHAADPLSYWSFDENTGTTAEDQWGRNDLTLTDSSMWNTSALNGTSGVKWDANTDEIRQATGNIVLDEDHCYSYFFRPYTVEASAARQFDFHDSSYSFQFGYADNSPNQFFTKHDKYQASVACTIHQKDISDLISKGDYTHIVVCWDEAGQDADVFFDTVEASQTTCNNAAAAGSAWELVIGDRGDDIQISPRISMMDEFKVFNGTTLTTQEIHDLYACNDHTGCGSPGETYNIETGDTKALTSQNANTNYSLYYENLSVYSEITNNDQVRISIGKAHNGSQTTQVNTSSARFILPANISDLNVTDQHGHNLPFNYTYGLEYNTLNVTLSATTLGDLINITIEGKTQYPVITNLTDPWRIKINNTLLTSQVIYATVTNPSLFINESVQHEKGMTYLERGTNYSSNQQSMKYYDPEISIYPVVGATITTKAYENSSQILNLILHDPTSNNDSYIYLSDKVGSSISCTRNGIDVTPTFEAGTGWGLNLAYIGNVTNINCTYPPEVYSVTPTSFNPGSSFIIGVAASDHKTANASLSVDIYYAYTDDPGTYYKLDTTHNVTTQTFRTSTFTPTTSYNVYASVTDGDGAVYNTTEMTVSEAVAGGSGSTGSTGSTVSSPSGRSSDSSGSVYKPPSRSNPTARFSLALFAIMAIASFMIFVFTNRTFFVLFGVACFIILLLITMNTGVLSVFSLALFGNVLWTFALFLSLGLIGLYLVTKGKSSKD